ncbi:hypothetical protein ElyMa_005637400 [Elysia marginata]|uniref:Death domain-containing protein n=1 Tax=Elysia marginata TaxID=1093978 RepID=A0AAV4FB79_9GAST|nr:hypothetical protein ElyMa_005637400 [Elysia marginata]
MLIVFFFSQRMLFLVIFADSCTHMRNALEVIKTWVKTDTNYVTFIKNDLSRLEQLKEEKVQQLRTLREQYHTLTFKLTYLEGEYAKRAGEANTLREKEGDMRIEEVYLVNSLTSLKREDAKDQLPNVIRHLGVVRQKLEWIAKSMATLEKISSDILITKKELKQVAVDRERREAEFCEVGLSVDVAKRIFMCKNANDAVEKLHYSICMENRASRVIKPLQECKIQDPLDRACKVTALRILGDWPSLYSNLPFYPSRGSQTVARDIVEVTDNGGRCSHTFKARRALERWRRYHTRANVDDLKRALKKIRRADVVHHIEDVQTKSTGSSTSLSDPNVSQAPFEKEEEKQPDVEPHLIPFFKQVEKYDQMVATRKLEVLNKAKRRAARRRLELDEK